MLRKKKKKKSESAELKVTGRKERGNQGTIYGDIKKYIQLKCILVVKNCKRRFSGTYYYKRDNLLCLIFQHFSVINIIVMIEVPFIMRATSLKKRRSNHLLQFFRINMNHCLQRFLI